MSDLSFLTTLRFSERLIADLGGIVALVLGALLFKWGASGSASLVVDANKTKFKLLNAAPGIFFALFGCGVLALALIRPLHYSEATGSAGVGTTGQGEKPSTTVRESTGAGRVKTTVQGEGTETTAPGEGPGTTPHQPTGAGEVEVTAQGGGVGKVAHKSAGPDVGRKVDVLYSAKTSPKALEFIKKLALGKPAELKEIQSEAQDLYRELVVNKADKKP